MYDAAATSEKEMHVKIRTLRTRNYQLTYTQIQPDYNMAVYLCTHKRLR